jgi:hypothetical protein
MYVRLKVPKWRILLRTMSMSIIVLQAPMHTLVIWGEGPSTTRRTGAVLSWNLTNNKLEGVLQQASEHMFATNLPRDQEMLVLEQCSSALPNGTHALGLGLLRRASSNHRCTFHFVFMETH